MGSSHTTAPNTFSTPTTWASGAYYLKDRQVFHNSELYIASAGHTSAAATEPGVGVNWATVWTVASYGMTANQNAALNTATALDGTHPPLVKDSDITTAKLTVIANTSGTNTGDETAARISTLTTFLTVVAAEAATGLADNERYYVVENESTYRVETAGSAYARDGLWILNTGAGGDTRLLAVAGKYVLQGLAVKGAVYTPDIALTLTDSTATPNFALGNNFTLTLAGTDTLANPTNPTVGQSGRITIRQPVAGAKTLAFGTYYLFTGGVDQTVASGASAVSVLYYDVLSSTEIACTMLAGIA